MIKAALFDMDGTIYDTERIYTEGWLKGAHYYGYPLTEEMLIDFHGQSKEQNGDTFRRLFGPDAKYWETRAIRQEYVNHKIKTFGVPVKPGLYEILKVLRDRNITICIATASERERAEKMWAETGITDQIDYSVSGGEVARCKPFPDIFLAAAKKSGAKPEECLVFEDARNGIVAAHTAGCHPILIPDTEPVTEELETLTDHIFTTLKDAADWIKAGGLDKY